MGKVDPSGLTTLERIRALQEKDARIKRMVKENLAQGVSTGSRGGLGSHLPTYNYVVVTDVLGDSVVSIVFQAKKEQLGYGDSWYGKSGMHYEHYAWVTTYKPVYEITRKISKLQRKNVSDVVRSLRTPRAVRHMVAMAKGKEREEQLQALVVSAEILHGLTPLATGIEEWRAGKRGSALLSFAGDAATILSLGSLGAAKYAQVARGVTKAGKWSGTIRVATTGLGLAEGAGRGVQGVVLLYETDGRKGYGYIGEAFLRLMGVAADVKASRIARQGTSHAEEVADAASLTRRANSGDDAVDAAAAAGRVDVPGGGGRIRGRGELFEERVRNTFRNKIIRQNEVLRDSAGRVIGEIDFETAEAIVEVGTSLKKKLPQLHKLAGIAKQRAKRLDVIYGPDTPPGTLKAVKQSLRKKWGSRVRFIPHE